MFSAETGPCRDSLILRGVFINSVILNPAGIKTKLFKKKTKNS